jgi:sporulation protein YlmC with PRC-barrel domain
MAAGRVIHAGLGLLDRQLVDRTGRLCGKVDDVELSEPDEQGRLYVEAIICGPGALLTRSGHRQFGQWLRRMTRREFRTDSEDAGRVPLSRVADIGNHVTLAMDGEEVATFAVERWTRDHVICHIPGSGYETPQ